MKVPFLTHKASTQASFLIFCQLLHTTHISAINFVVGFVGGRYFHNISISVNNDFRSLSAW